MKFCDITMAYNESSGGIRTYIHEKRRYLLDHTEHEHLLIVPGETDRVERCGRSKIVYLAGPLLPNQDAYRFFVRPDRIREVLLAHRPDVVELGSYYLEPWAVFAYRDRLREAGENCLVGCYFHTDVAEAYVAAPLRSLAHDWFEDWSETLASLGEKLAVLAGSGAERYIRSVFAPCDLAIAPSQAQAERLRGYGIENVEIVPLGVDLELFHPRRRDEAVRAGQGASAESCVLIYAGRLSAEKRVFTLVETLKRLPASAKARLWITGHGPLAEALATASEALPALRLLPYERDRTAFASLLASADVYLTAGPHETFALSVIEAQACGLPVVGVAAGALRDRVPDGLGFLGPVDDTAAMAEHILRAYASRSEIGLKARQHVEANFGWDSTFRRLLSCYAARSANGHGTIASAQG